MFAIRLVFWVAALQVLPVVLNALPAKNDNSALRGGDSSYPFLSALERELQCSLSDAPVGDTPECALVTAQDFDLCFGVRGNGAKLFAHFPALAKAVESFGIPTAYAGGSSATITGFLFESILENPLIADCGGGQCCSDMEQRARVSFLLKTFEDIAQDSFLAGIYILPQTLLKRAQDQNIPFRLASPIGTNKEAALQDLLTILSEPFGALQSTLVNPELIELLSSTSANPIRHAADVLRATARGFDTAEDPLSFMREYILNFNGVAWLLDFVASFWAGLDPTNLVEMQTLLTDCGTVANMGKKYSEIKPQLTSSGKNCTKFYRDMWKTFLTDRKAYETLIGEDTGFPSRLDVNSGQAKLSTLILTSVVTGNALSTVTQGIENYKNLIFDVDPFDIDFENEVFFGYYGPDQALSTINSTISTLFTDAKSQKFFPLGPTPWRKALTSSPAEPTLGNAVDSGVQSLLSLGGWVDPAPAQVLRSLGCDRVVLINRPGGLGNFSTGIAELLGASEEQLDALFGLDNPESGLDVALQTMNATFCVDWDNAGLSPTGLAEAAYEAKFISDDACILSLDVGAEFIGLQTETKGCVSMLSEAPPNASPAPAPTGTTSPPAPSPPDGSPPTVSTEASGGQTTSGTGHAAHWLALVSAAIACLFIS